MVGAWRLISIYAAPVGFDERADLHALGPQGYAVFEAGGRMMALLTSSGREAAADTDGVAALYRSMTAYTGRWRIDGKKFATKVDMAW